MTSLRRALWCLAAAGFVFGVIDLALILTSDFAPHVMGPFGLVIGWGFIGAGLFAWSRRPDNRVGMLMAATGFAWLLAGLGLSDIPLLFALGSAFGSVYFATAVHMLLAAPSGRLQTRGERRIVATTYALTAGVVPAMFVLIEPARDFECSDCPSNPLLIWSNETLVDVISLVVNAIGLLLVVLTLVNLVRRWRRASAPGAPALRPDLRGGRRVDDHADRHAAVAVDVEGRRGRGRDGHALDAPAGARCPTCSWPPS